MKLNDALLGLVVALLGGAIVLGARSFPQMAHFQYGPGFFPTLLGSLLVASGLIMGLRGLRTVGRTPLVELAAWTRSRRHVVDGAGVVAAVVFYNLTVHTLGFPITAFLMLAALFLRLRGRVGEALVLALLITLVAHQAFVELLLVPLPWGVLEPFSGVLTWR
ncbi:tripartite tricarboxylate transporter TctB family protein [Geminicoccaceae bacterium 1502E]|nr:tripartite tricarboxylate transporter TctB family protein [Geminicoccaceae bacterium 1502E]